MISQAKGISISAVLTQDRTSRRNEQPRAGCLRELGGGGATAAPRGMMPGVQVAPAMVHVRLRRIAVAVPSAPSNVANATEP